MWIRSQNKEVLAKVSDLYVVIGVECEDLEDGYDTLETKTNALPTPPFK